MSSAERCCRLVRGWSILTPRSPILAEFIGTLILVVLGNDVVANVVLNQTKGHNFGWIVITTGWALAVTFTHGIFIGMAVGVLLGVLFPDSARASRGSSRRAT